MIVRHIKLHNSFQLDPFRVYEIECLTGTKLLIEPECIQIVGEPQNSRRARLLIQHSILLTYLIDDPPFLYQHTEIPKSNDMSWQQFSIETIKQALNAFNTTLNMFSKY